MGVFKVSKTTTGFRNKRVLQSQGVKKNDNAQPKITPTDSNVVSTGRKAARKKTSSKNDNNKQNRIQMPRQSPASTKIKNSNIQTKGVVDQTKTLKRNPFSGNTATVAKQQIRPIETSFMRQNTTKSVPFTTMNYKKITI
jgi:hypothetical protein